MEVVEVVMPVIISVLAIILLVVLIILGIKMIKLVDKTNLVVDDIQTKVSKLDGFFRVVDGVTDTMTYVSDRFVGMAINRFGKIFKRKKGNKRKDDIYE